MRNEADILIGNAISNARILVDVPFGPEYPAPDQWNLLGARLRYQPTERGRPLSYPHYQMVLDHCGQSLTLAVRQDPWCRKHELKTGGDYLFLWAASLFQRPEEMLPWLFLYGWQNSGKSAYHEMLEVLMTKGCRKIDKVFTRDSTFSGELAGTILGIVEEADLTRKPTKAYNMLKDLIGARYTTIEKKGWDAFDTRNYCHVVHTANKLLACPILEEDDSRVTVILCAKIPESIRIPKRMLRRLWEKEAADFLRALLDLKLPEPDVGDDRLFLPALWTPAKWKIIEGMKKIAQAEPSQRPALVLAQQISPSIHFMATAGWIIHKTASQILGGLRWLQVEDLPDSPEEIGQSLSHINRDGLIFEEGKSGSRRWLTIATPRALEIHKWCEELSEPEWSEDEIYAEVANKADMIGI
ncbi:MAG: primase-helicase family protein [Thermoguttaceae bacterium]